MKTSQFAEQLENLPKDQKMAILAIIDLKVENDMEKVLHKLDSMEKSMNSRFESMDTRITVLYWLIGALGVFLSVLKFLE